MPSKIRLGLIGVSTSSKSTSWAVRAHMPYFQSAQGQEHYEIVALCNSTIDSAKKHIEHFKLPSTTKEYDSTAELAADSNVDLVVCVVGPASHHKLALPVVQAGKDIYIELPMTSNISQMRELKKIADEKGSKIILGVQGQTSPVIKVVKDVIASGKIGKVLSTSFSGNVPYLGEKPLPLGYEMFTKREIGSNMVAVAFFHSINFILAALGELDTFHSILGNQRPDVDIFDPAQGAEVIKTVQKDTPDQIMLQGRLETGALIAYSMRGGDAFPGLPGADWRIYGEKGEIRVTHPLAAVLDIMHAGVVIKVVEFGKEEEELSLPSDDYSGLAEPAQNVGRIYGALAKGEYVPDANLALKRHELMAQMWKRSDGETPFGEGMAGV